MSSIPYSPLLQSADLISQSSQKVVAPALSKIARCSTVHALTAMQLLMARPFFLYERRSGDMGCTHVILGPSACIVELVAALLYRWPLATVATWTATVRRSLRNSHCAQILREASAPCDLVLRTFQLQ